MTPWGLEGDGWAVEELVLDGSPAASGLAKRFWATIRPYRVDPGMIQVVYCFCKVFRCFERFWSGL